MAKSFPICSTEIDTTGGLEALALDENGPIRAKLVWVSGDIDTWPDMRQVTLVGPPAFVQDLASRSEGWPTKTISAFIAIAHAHLHLKVYVHINLHLCRGLWRPVLSQTVPAFEFLSENFPIQRSSVSFLGIIIVLTGIFVVPDPAAGMVGLSVSRQYSITFTIP
jgi:hypothetical protein